MPSQFESGLKFNNKESTRGKEILPEEVERVEGSKMAIDDKINLLLTKGGLKPASEILLVIKTQDNEGLTEHMNEKEVREALSIVQKSGLPYRVKDRETVQEPYWTKNEPNTQRFYKREQMEILVGHSPEDLELLERALESKSGEIMGRAFGFPPTAIEAFVGKKEQLDRLSLPQNIRYSDGILFSSPTLSKDNWREEIRQGQRYGEFIKKLSPKLYEEMRAMAIKTIEGS